MARRVGRLSLADRTCWARRFFECALQARTPRERDDVERGLLWLQLMARGHMRYLLPPTIEAAQRLTRCASAEGESDPDLVREAGQVLALHQKRLEKRLRGLPPWRA